jgi:hypothetical protein
VLIRRPTRPANLSSTITGQDDPTEGSRVDEAYMKTDGSVKETRQ